MKNCTPGELRALAVCLVAACGSQPLLAQTATGAGAQPATGSRRRNSHRLRSRSPTPQTPRAAGHRPAASAAGRAGRTRRRLRCRSRRPPLPSGYVIGPDDVLTVSYWRNPDMSAEVTVRPDGLISLPLLNEIQAGGLTPEQLRDKIVEGRR